MNKKQWQIGDVCKIQPFHTKWCKGKIIDFTSHYDTTYAVVQVGHVEYRVSLNMLKAIEAKKR